jgi:hypothetical protein
MRCLRLFELRPRTSARGRDVDIALGGECLRGYRCTRRALSGMGSARRTGGCVVDVVDTWTKTKTNACARRGEGGRDDDSELMGCDAGCALLLYDTSRRRAQHAAQVHGARAADEEAWMGDAAAPVFALRSSFLAEEVGGTDTHELLLPSFVCVVWPRAGGEDRRTAPSALGCAVPSLLGSTRSSSIIIWWRLCAFLSLRFCVFFFFGSCFELFGRYNSLDYLSTPRLA